MPASRRESWALTLSTSARGTGSQAGGGLELRILWKRAWAESSWSLACDTPAGLKETRAVKQTGPRGSLASLRGKVPKLMSRLGLVGCLAVTIKLWKPVLAAKICAS